MCNLKVQGPWWKLRTSLRGPSTKFSLKYYCAFVMYLMHLLCYFFIYLFLYTSVIDFLSFYLSTAQTLPPSGRPSRDTARLACLGSSSPCRAPARHGFHLRPCTGAAMADGSRLRASSGPAKFLHNSKQLKNRWQSEEVNKSQSIFFSYRTLKISNSL